MASKTFTLKNIERNSKGDILDIEILDPLTGDTLRLVRSDDIDGDIKKVSIRTTDKTQLIGEVNMGKYSRVSDLFAFGKRFQPVFNTVSGGANERTLFINKDQVIHVEEME